MQGHSAPKQVLLRNGHQFPHLPPPLRSQQRRRPPSQIYWLKDPLAWQQQRWPIDMS